MQEKELFQIGEVARMFSLSVQTLRHYEKIGLLRPEHTDPATGYRWYSVRQFEVLNTIRYLRALDMPLARIADFLENRDVGKIEQMLRRQKDEVSRRQMELARIGRKIDNRLRQLDDVKSRRLYEIRLEMNPPCRIVWLRMKLRISGFFDMETPIQKLAGFQTEAVVFLGKIGVGISAENLSSGKFDQYDGIFLILDEEDRFSGDVQVMPERLCVSVRFRGSHSEAPAQYGRLMEFIRSNGLVADGFSHEITMIDYGFTADPEKFIAEIRIPVRRKSAPEKPAISS